MLEPILQSVGAGNPQLAHLIGQHPDQFLQLLSEESDGDVPLPPGAQEISVTEEERAAIERVSFTSFRASFSLFSSREQPGFPFSYSLLNPPPLLVVSPRF